MSLLLHQIIRAARVTFDPKNTSSTAQNYAKLKALVDKLSADDINLPMNILSGRQIPPAYRNGPPATCGFVSLFNHPDVVISIFILASNQELPLHDHPHMYGILKAITGKITIRGYTAIDDQNRPIVVPRPESERFIEVRPEPPVTISVDKDAVVLSPSVGNFHQISAVDGPAAFFDILSPPYNTEIPVYGSRPCTYYKTISEGKRLFLESCECPESYISAHVPYDDLYQSAADS